MPLYLRDGMEARFINQISSLILLTTPTDIRACRQARLQIRDGLRSKRPCILLKRTTCSSSATITAITVLLERWTSTYITSLFIAERLLQLPVNFPGDLY